MSFENNSFTFDLSVKVLAARLIFGQSHSVPPPCADPHPRGLKCVCFVELLRRPGGIALLACSWVTVWWCGPLRPRCRWWLWWWCTAASPAAAPGARFGRRSEERLVWSPDQSDPRRWRSVSTGTTAGQGTMEFAHFTAQTHINIRQMLHLE